MNVFMIDPEYRRSYLFKQYTAYVQSDVAQFDHLVHAIAADIERHCMQPGAEAVTKRIAQYVRGWKP